MILPDAMLSIARLPLARLVVTEYQMRHFDRLKHYYDLLSLPENAHKAPGLISVKPLPDGYFEILDGHHRFCAHVMTGREDALCVVIEDA